jgi:hypothetical protein
MTWAARALTTDDLVVALVVLLLLIAVVKLVRDRKARR